MHKLETSDLRDSGRIAQMQHLMILKRVFAVRRKIAAFLFAFERPFSVVPVNVLLQFWSRSIGLSAHVALKLLLRGRPIVEVAGRFEFDVISAFLLLIAFRIRQHAALQIVVDEGRLFALADKGR